MFFNVQHAYILYIWHKINHFPTSQSNKLEEIPPGALGDLRNLRELYLQNNLLTNAGIDNETFRWAKHITQKTKPSKYSLLLKAQIQSTDLLHPSLCSQLSSLEYLDLSNNNLSVVPKGLPRNLLLLHLEKNAIHSIPGDTLVSVRNLEYLLLHNNKLRSRSIHPMAFQVNFKNKKIKMY